MSDRVALNGRSTCDERTRDRNAREPFLNHAQAHLAPKPPVFESRRMRERSCKHTSLMITHNDQTSGNTKTIYPKILSNYTFQTQKQYYMDKNTPGKQFKQDVTN